MILFGKVRRILVPIFVGVVAFFCAGIGPLLADNGGPMCDLCQVWYGFCVIEPDPYFGELVCCLDNCELHWHGIECEYECLYPE